MKRPKFNDWGYDKHLDDMIRNRLLAHMSEQHYSKTYLGNNLGFRERTNTPMYDEIYFEGVCITVSREDAEKLAKIRDLSEFYRAMGKLSRRYSD